MQTGVGAEVLTSVPAASPISKPHPKAPYSPPPPTRAVVDGAGRVRVGVQSDPLVCVSVGWQRVARLPKGRPSTQGALPYPTPPSPRTISALTAERVINAGDAGKELHKIKKHVPTSPVRIVLI